MKRPIYTTTSDEFSNLPRGWYDKRLRVWNKTSKSKNIDNKENTNERQSPTTKNKREREPNMR